MISAPRARSDGGTSAWPGGQCTEQGQYGPQVCHEGQCVDYCPDGSLNRFHVCIQEEACIQQGGVTTSDGHCLEQCPEGQQQYGSWCGISCPAGEYPRNGVCEDDTVVPCAEGEIRSNGQCVPEPGYDEFRDQCREAVDAGAADPGDMSAQEFCAAFIEDLCDGAGVYAGDSLACRERPCGEGRENVDGTCRCSGGQVGQADGSCAASYPAGTLLEGINECVAQCQYGAAVNSQCQCQD